MTIKGLLPSYMRLRLEDNFYADEFVCPCHRCGGVDPQMDQIFMRMLQMAREGAKTPFKITSGYRCSDYQKEINPGLSGASSHEKGVAADIGIENSSLRYSILVALLYAGFCRVGIYDRHIHVDSDPDKPAAIWLGTSK